MCQQRTSATVYCVCRLQIIFDPVSGEIDADLAVVDMRMLCGPLSANSGHCALYRPSLFIPCGTAKFSDLSLTHINVQIVFLRSNFTKRVQEVFNADLQRNIRKAA